MAIIKATNIRKSFSNIEILKGIDLEIQHNELVSIVGVSGAGKSTLLHTLGTLLPLEKGSHLEIDGIDVSKLKDKALSRLRNEAIGFVFQSHGLLPEFTALENVMLAALIKGERKKIAYDKAMSLLERLGIDSRAKHQPSQMSGGECQRIAVARALVNDPSVIFADEPTGSLDSANRESLHKIIFDLKTQTKKTFVIVTHDDSFANLCDRKITLSDGLIKDITCNKKL